jgi:hypothetical protein
MSKNVAQNENVEKYCGGDVFYYFKNITKRHQMPF